MAQIWAQMMLPVGMYIAICKGQVFSFVDWFGDPQMNSWLSSLIPAALLAMPLVWFGCFTSGGGECSIVCADLNRLGCCGELRTEVACDAACPSGMIEETMCRTSGCETCDQPVDCYGNRGTGCCDPSDHVESCGACPAGYTPMAQCTDEFPACECGGESGDRIGPPMGVTCYEDAGSGCCGTAREFQCGDCPPGWLSSAECVDSGGGQPMPVPPVGCRVDEGGGCCGAYVATNACGTCPSGAIWEYECGTADMPAMECFIDEGGGCCGAVVAATICGMCPEGSVESSRCVAPPEVPIEPPSECYEVDDAGCCGDSVMRNQCGLCPPGSSEVCAFC